MAVSYAASHPDLPGDGITPTTGPESARPAFEAAADTTTPQISPHEAREAEKIGDSRGLAPVRATFTDSELGKPRDPAPRLEPHPNVVKQVHAALFRTRQFAPRPQGGTRPSQSVTARPPASVQPLRTVTIGPKSEQERDLGAAMAAYQRMQNMTGIRQEFGRKHGRNI